MTRSRLKENIVCLSSLKIYLCFMQTKNFLSHSNLQMGHFSGHPVETNITWFSLLFCINSRIVRKYLIKIARSYACSNLRGFLIIFLGLKKGLNIVTPNESLSVNILGCSVRFHKRYVSSYDILSENIGKTIL